MDTIRNKSHVKLMEQARIVIATFYKFVKLPDYREIQPALLRLCEQHGIKGSILIAEEGINATIAGTQNGIDMVLESLQDDPRFELLTVKFSHADYQPFGRMKVRLKREIVRLKVDDIDPSREVGTYVDPDDWNALISDPDVIVIDTRNDYEVQLGTFKNAVNPQTDAFHELPDFVAENLDPQRHKKVAMFCTGGIRCEKATAFLLQQGFQDVYHLNGGILRYLELMPQEESLWDGECFVFDERVAVDHDLKPGKSAICAQCNTVYSDGSQPCPQCGHIQS